MRRSSRASVSRRRCSAASPAASSRAPIRWRRACGSAASCRRLANLAFSWQAMIGHDIVMLDRRDHGGEFHQRDRHRDLRRLSVGAVPQPAAHRDAIRAAHRAGGVRPHLSVVRRRLSWRRRPAGSWFFAICALAAIPEPAAARVAAAARAFRAASRTTKRRLKTACAAGSPPTACPRRDSRARRRPARHARAASPSRWHRATGR